MKDFYLGMYAPVTFYSAFIRVPYDVLAGPFTEWMRSNHPNSTTAANEGPLQAVLERLAPLTAPATKEAVVDCGSEWTAILSNGIVSDAFSRAPYWSKRMRAQAVAVSCVPDRFEEEFIGARGAYRAMQVQTFDPADDGKIPRRTLSSVHDGNRWTFINEGEPFEFESVEKYRLARVRDRVSRADICSFMRHFGLPTREDLFGTRSTMVDTNRAARRALTFDQARRELGIVVM